ncbi:hypothetical protein [Rhizobium laguerreae]|uniref:hypothetical protein n=1 Tax=Rhizobium laguerreae TaxID=1076926 RepID=UPI003AAC8EE6
MDIMVSRLRKTLTVQQRAAAFDHTNKIAMEAAEDECRRREEKNERLRKLRLGEAHRVTGQADAPNSEIMPEK